MKKPFLIFFITICNLNLAQNLIQNGNFQAGNLSPWLGFNNQILTDNLTNSSVGNVNNGEGSLYQTLNLIAGETYTVAFDYRWVSGTGNYNMTVRAKDENGPDFYGEFVLNATPDVWHNAVFTFSVPAENTDIRLVFYKINGNRPLRLDNVLLTLSPQQGTFVDSETPLNAQPLGVAGNWTLDFSDEFNGNALNLNKWQVSISTTTRAPRPDLGISDWWWKPENVSMNGNGQLVLSAVKHDFNTMYCGSVESKNLYEPTFGFLEARIKIATTAKGNHTAFWTQGHNMNNVDNSAADGAEIDIFESAWVTNDTKAVVHFDGYGPFKKNHTIPFNTPGLHVGYHTFGLHWTPTAMNIYYDGVLVQSTNPNKPFPFTVDPNGYPLVPQVPEWLWLSVGASFADGDFISQPVGHLSDALVDYVRVYKNPETLSLNNLDAQPKEFLLFPNPAQNSFQIKTNVLQYEVQIFDQNGRCMAQFKQPSVIDVSQFEKGLYFVNISSNQKNEIQKIIVN